MEEQQQAPDIRRYLNIIYKRRYQFLAAAAVIIAIAVAVSYLVPRTYEATTTVSVEKNYLKELMKDITLTSSVDDRVQALSAVMMSRSMLLKVMADLSMGLSTMTEAETERHVRGFQKTTQIKSDTRASRRDMELFTVSYRDRDPRFARDYVNALVRRYIVDSLSAKKEQAAGASKFVIEQMDLYRKKLAEAEVDLAQRLKEHNVQLIARLAELRRKYDALMVQYTEQHPEVVRVRTEMDSIQEKIRRGKETDGENLGDAAKTGSAGSARGATKKSIADLERDREAYKKIYESLVASLGKSQVSEKVETQVTADTFHILDPAILPVLPLGPTRWQMILLGLLAGIAGGAGVVILLDMMDRTIRTIDTLRGFGLPVIGVIPRIENAAVLASTKRKDLLLYGAAGMYIAGVVALAAVEFLK